VQTSALVERVEDEPFDCLVEEVVLFRQHVGEEAAGRLATELGTCCLKTPIFVHMGNPQPASTIARAEKRGRRFRVCTDVSDRAHRRCSEGRR